MLALKLSKIGNSVGVLLPKEMIIKMHAQVGDTIYATETSEGYALRPYDESFIKQMELAKKIIHENRDVLKVLSE